MWVLINQNGRHRIPFFSCELIVDTNLIFSIKDREIPKAAVALEKAFGGIIDQVEYNSPFSYGRY